MTPLLLIHGGGLAGWFTPLAAEPALRNYDVIRMVRAGYTDDPAPPGLTISDHAEQAAARLNGIPAHVVAHSSGSAIALQLALDHPDLVRTLSLVEPPLVDPLVDPADLEMLHAAFGPVMGATMAAIARGDTATAFETFMGLVCGPDHRAIMEKTLGADVVEDGVARSRYFFTEEAAALTAWTFDPAYAARLHMPVQLIQGGDSPPPVHRLVTHLAGLIPGATIATVPGTNHLMPLTAPAELARLIDTFAMHACT